MNFLDNALFGLYPYICLSVFLLGSLIRFDRDQYTWKSDSSQLLRAGQLRLGSNLFHIGVLFLFFGHLVGLLTPHFLYAPFISAGVKQVSAMTAGGIAGVLVGLSGGLATSAVAGWRVIFTVTPIVISFACAFLTGIIFGYLPARKAARLNPIEALARD